MPAASRCSRRRSCRRHRTVRTRGCGGGLTAAGAVLGAGVTKLNVSAENASLPAALRPLFWEVHRPPLDALMHAD